MVEIEADFEIGPQVEQNHDPTRTEQRTHSLVHSLNQPHTDGGTVRIWARVIGEGRPRAKGKRGARMRVMESDLALLRREASTR